MYEFDASTTNGVIWSLLKITPHRWLSNKRHTHTHTHTERAIPYIVGDDDSTTMTSIDSIIIIIVFCVIILWYVRVHDVHSSRYM